MEEPKYKVGDEVVVKVHHIDPDGDLRMEECDGVSGCVPLGNVLRLASAAPVVQLASALSRKRNAIAMDFAKIMLENKIHSRTDAIVLYAYEMADAMIAEGAKPIVMEEEEVPTSYPDWQRLSAWYGNAEMG